MSEDAPTLQQLVDEIARLERTAAAHAAREFPVGSQVRFYYGDHERRARVVDHDQLRPRVRVVGETGAPYWVSAIKLIPVASVARLSDRRRA